MSRLSPVLDEWVDHVVELSRCCVGFPRAVLADRLAETFGCLVSWNWAEPDGSFGFELHGEVAGHLGFDEVNAWVVDGMRAHPLLRWFARTGDPLPMTVGRVPEQLAPPRGWAYLKECLEEPGWDQQLSIPHHLGPASYRAFVLAQTRHDFADEQLDLARRLQPLLALLDRQAEVLTRASDPALAGAVADLTCREVAVLRLLAEGLTAAAIASRLLVSARTVHTHLSHIYRKLGVRDRMMAVMVARELGLVPPMVLGPAADAPLSGRAFEWSGPRVFGTEPRLTVVRGEGSDVVDDHVELRAGRRG